MSQIKVEVVTVEIVPHPNADKLELCKVKGWQCVVRKGEFKTGDSAIYIPLDSVLPDSLVKKLGIENFYKNYVRTVKLRGCISQGLIAPLDILCFISPNPEIGEDIAGLLGITKYEEPIPINMRGKLLPRNPEFFIYTDIENIKNYPDIFGPDDEVVISEKIHGTNFRAAKIDGKILVGSHTQNMAYDADNLYWRAAKMLGVEIKLNEGEHIFGEIYGPGIQDLHYGLNPGEIGVVIFDVWKDGNYLKHSDYTTFCRKWEWKMPVYYIRTFIDIDSINLDAESDLARFYGVEQIREGHVIRTLNETYSERLQGRLIIKKISDEYLLRKSGTERH